MTPLCIRNGKIAFTFYLSFPWLLYLSSDVKQQLCLGFELIYHSHHGSIMEKFFLHMQSCSEYRGLLQLHYSVLLYSEAEFWSRGVLLHGVE